MLHILCRLDIGFCAQAVSLVLAQQGHDVAAGEACDESSLYQSTKSTVGVADGVSSTVSSVLLLLLLVDRRLLLGERQLHTTTRFSVQPLASTSSPSGSSIAPVHEQACPASAAPEKTSHDLKKALKTGLRSQIHATLSRLGSDARSQLDRDTFDELFQVLCYDQSLDAVAWKKNRISKNWNAVKQLRHLAHERQWQLSPEQLRVCFRTGVEWELERHDRQDQNNAQRDDAWNTPEREQQRREYLDNLRASILDLDRSSPDDAIRDANAVELYASALLKRGDELDVALNVLYQAFELDKRSLKEHSDATGFAPAPSASAFLPILFQRDSNKALAHLNRMLDYRRIPTVASLRAILLEQQMSEDSEAAYAEARRILDVACASSSTASAQLDELYQRRLSRIAGEEEIRKRPVLSFLRWIGIHRDSSKSDTTVTQEQWTTLAFRLWQAQYAPREWHEPLSSEGDKILDELVVQSCILAAEDTGAPQEPPALLQTAIDASLQYMSVHQLASRARLLLDTAAQYDRLSSARTLYAQLKQRISPYHSFTWHAKSRSTFSKLVLSTLVPGPIDDPTRPIFAAGQAAFVVELYQDWTKAGLQFPQGLWRHLWLALGDLGDVDQLARVVKDFEETGRGQVTTRIIDFVIQTSARKPGRHYSKTLELVKFFRSRSKTWFARNQDAAVWTAYNDDAFTAATSSSINHATRVSLSSYEAVLRQLAKADSDRESDAIKTFQQIIQDEFEPRTSTFNALLANQVLKSRLQKVDVVDNSRAVYDAIVRRKLEPDRITMSLVVHGLLRLAIGDFVEPETEKVGELVTATNGHDGTTYIEAAIKAFDASVDRNLLISGVQTALLIYTLGSINVRQWDKAKFVAEQWWNEVVSVEQKLGKLRNQVAKSNKGDRDRTDQFARDVERVYKSLQRDIQVVERAQRDVLQFERDLMALGDESDEQT
ncbi:hypothetical protein OIV83_003696 [Microbotryomycetes sp. JL201]|nr:hypothetical protein OIV83_003696 [Microbotryomycetes sp. JL201]